MTSLQKINRILFFMLGIYGLFYFGSSFLIPLVFGVFFASLVSPLCNLIEKARIPRIIASFISTLVIFIVVGGVMYLFIYQLSLFVTDLSIIRREFLVIIENLRDQLTSMTGISLEDQQRIWQERSGDVINTLESSITKILSDVASTIFSFMLVLLYVFLFTYYRDKFAGFVMMYTTENKKENMGKIMEKVGRVVYHYLWGRAKVMALLAVMYYITFLIFDIPFAVLLTIFGALVTIIPYVGPFVSGLLPIFFSIIFMDSTATIILFSSIIVSIQLIESYVFEPLVIGSEVKLNPLMVIIAIIMGGMIWGLAGMFLFVPMFAMLKIVARHSQGLEPLAYVMGPSREKPHSGKNGTNVSEAGNA